MEEIVCDATMAFVNDSESFRDAVAKDKTFGQKVSKFLHDMAEWFMDTFVGAEIKHAAKYLESQAELFKEAAQKWARMAEVAGVADVSSLEARYSIETVDTNSVLKDRKYVVVINGLKEISKNKNPIPNGR